MPFGAFDIVAELFVGIANLPAHPGLVAPHGETRHRRSALLSPHRLVGFFWVLGLGKSGRRRAQCEDSCNPDSYRSHYLPVWHLPLLSLVAPRQRAVFKISEPLERMSRGALPRDERLFAIKMDCAAARMPSPPGAGPDIPVLRCGAPPHQPCSGPPQRL